MTLVFYSDRYQFYRDISFVTGILVGGVVLIYIFRHQLGNGPIIPFALLPPLFLCFALLNRQRDYMAVKDKALIVSSLLTSTAIPIESINSLIYEDELASVGLLVRYLQHDIERQKKIDIYSYNTYTLNLFNETVLGLNPHVQITIQPKAKKFLERNKNLHLKAPTSRAGWAFLAVRFFLIGAVLSMLLLYFGAPKK